MRPTEAAIDWSLCTWKGSRRKQHQDFHAIPFSRKLEIIEEMNRSALAATERRRARGQPYIDPYTGERVTRSRIQEMPASEVALAPGRQTTRCSSALSPIASRQQIEEFARQLVEKFRPERIVLFGSHADGTATHDSDVDLLVVMSHEGNAVQKAIEIRLVLDAPFPLNLIVRDAAVLKQRIASGDFFLREVLEKGISLHESAGARMAAES